MGAVKPLVKELTQYIGKMSEQQQKALLQVVKSFSAEDDRWSDKTYIAEMDKRFAEMESGKVKTLSLEDMEAGARKYYRNRKRN